MVKCRPWNGPTTHYIHVKAMLFNLPEYWNFYICLQACANDWKFVDAPIKVYKSINVHQICTISSIFFPKIFVVIIEFMVGLL